MYVMVNEIFCIYNYEGWKVSWGVVVMSSLFVAPLYLTLAISPLQFPFVATLLRDSWEIIEVSPLWCCKLFFEYYDCFSTVSQLLSTAGRPFIGWWKWKIFFHFRGAWRVCARQYRQQAVMVHLPMISGDWAITAFRRAVFILCERGITACNNMSCL